MFVGKSLPPNAHRIGTRARESRRIREPEGLVGSVRGSKPKKTDAVAKLKPELVIDQPRYRAPTQFQRAAQHLRWQREGVTDNSAT